MKATFIVKSLATILPYLLAVVLCELILRFIGTDPRPLKVNHERPTKLSKGLGWIPKEGVFELSAFSDESKVAVTNWNGGRRATRVNETVDNCTSEVVILGGSLMQGYALDDEQSLGWKLQELLPKLKVENLAVGGYGGYQSYLRLKNYAKDPEICPRIFIYGVAPFHEARNVGSPENLIEWSRNSSTGSIKAPTTRLVGGNLIHNEYRAMPQFFLRNRLALVSVFEEIYLWVQPIPPLEEQRNIAFKLLKEMNEETKKVGAQFISFLVYFKESEKQAYIDFLKQNSIKYIDGSRSSYFSPKYQLLYDSHPNDKLTSAWAKQLAKALK